VISTNETVLVNNAISDENLTMSEIAHCYWAK